MNRNISALLACALILTLAGCQAEVEEPLLDTTVTVETAAAQPGDLSTQNSDQNSGCADQLVKMERLL